MDVSNMTPDELRELAARKEAASIYQAHTGITGGYTAAETPTRPEIPAQFARKVEVGGVEYTVDMRRVLCRETARRMVRAQAEQDENKRNYELTSLLDYIFEPISDEIEAAVTAEMGYVDYQRFYAICSDILEQINLKN